MAHRGEVLLRVTFGPSKSPLFSRAAAYAREHAEEAAQLTPGVWRASFRLSFSERPYGDASQLLSMVSGWRSTTVAVDGSPEPAWVVEQMLWCSREWLRAGGACRERFFPLATGWPKCRACPIFDPQWAAESGVTPGLGVFFDPASGAWLEIPDHLPKEWEED
jgi:hypothetical protein